MFTQKLMLSIIFRCRVIRSCQGERRPGSASSRLPRHSGLWHRPLGASVTLRLEVFFGRRAREDRADGSARQLWSPETALTRRLMGMSDHRPRSLSPAEGPCTPRDARAPGPRGRRRPLSCPVPSRPSSGRGALPCSPGLLPRRAAFIQTLAACSASGGICLGRDGELCPADPHGGATAGHDGEEGARVSPACRGGGSRERPAVLFRSHRTEAATGQRQRGPGPEVTLCLGQW